MRAIAIVHEGIPGHDSRTEAEAVNRMARRMHLDLHPRDIHCTGDLSVLLARLNTDQADVVLVPSEPHLRGWMDTLRRVTEVWTVDPPLCWPRGGGRPHSITRPDRHLKVAR